MADDYLRYKVKEDAMSPRNDRFSLDVKKRKRKEKKRPASSRPLITGRNVMIVERCPAMLVLASGDV